MKIRRIYYDKNTRICVNIGPLTISITEFPTSQKLSNYLFKELNTNKTILFVHSVSRVKKYYLLSQKDGKTKYQGKYLEYSKGR